MGLKGWLGLGLLSAALFLPPQGEAARPGEFALFLSPPQAVVELATVEQTTAVAEVQVQIIAPPQRPWRLFLQSQGPPLVLAGQPLPVLQLSWQGRPARFFRDGAAGLAGPQLCGQGQGPAQGLLQLRMQVPLAAGAGQWRQRLLFFLESP